MPRAPSWLVAGLGLRLVAQGCLWVLQCRRSRHWQLPIPAEPLHPIPGISPERPEANIAGLRIFIGWTRWDLRIGFGADYHCLGIITVVIFILPKGERQKETKTPNNQPQKTCGIYLT